MRRWRLCAASGGDRTRELSLLTGADGRDARQRKWQRCWLVNAMWPWWRMTTGRWLDGQLAQRASCDRRHHQVLLERLVPWCAGRTPPIANVQALPAAAGAPSKSPACAAPLLAPTPGTEGGLLGSPNLPCSAKKVHHTCTCTQQNGSGRGPETTRGRQCCAPQQPCDPQRLVSILMRNSGGRAERNVSRA